MISENSAKRLSISWEMSGLKVDDSSSLFTVLSFSGHSVDLGDSGQPFIPACSFIAGVPPQGTIGVSFKGLEVQTIHLKKALRKCRQDTNIKRYPNLHFSDTWLSDGMPCIFRQLHAERFIIKPFIYDEKKLTLQVLQKAQCIIEFPAYPQTREPLSVHSDYQKMISRLVLNFAIASTWAGPPRELPKRKSFGEFPLAPTKPMILFKIGDGHDGINEGATNENGIIKISGKDLVRHLGSPLSFNRLACYGSHKEELPVQTPDIAELPDGITEIPLVRNDLNNNGLVDSMDFVLIYVTGSSDWAFDTVSRQYYYNLNRYEDFRHYWLTSKPFGNAAPVQRMQPNNFPVTMSKTSFQNHFLLKKSIVLSSRGGDEGGLDWIWQRFSINSPRFEFQVFLPLADTSFPVQVKFGLDSTPRLATFSDATVCSACKSSQWYSINYAGDRTLKIIADNLKDKSFIEMNQLEFKYTSNIDISNGKALSVFSPESAGIVRYTCTNLPEQLVYIFRIGPSETIQLIDTVEGRTTHSFSWTDSAAKGITYFICPQSCFQPTPDLSVLPAMPSKEETIHDLRHLYSPVSNRVDFLVVSHPDFLPQARRLAIHKVNTGRFKAPKVIDILDIYREFSGGTVDPAALRNFFLYARSQWGLGPEYVVLLGKGHYNYKGIKTSESEYIPVAEVESDICEDDYFAILDSGKNPSSDCVSPDFFIGRLPCTTVQQATQMIDKIVDFEDPKVADFGAWRNKAVLVNDDDTQGVKIDESHDAHLKSSEELCNAINLLRPDVDVRKVNLFEYPFNELRFKPEAKTTLINEINNGASFVNYFGHGSISLWADEQILNSDALSSLHNFKRYPLISSFSCSVGRFDCPGQRSLAEDMVLAPQSGAIAAISATREAWASENQILAINFYSALFNTSYSGISFGEAYNFAKIQTGGSNSKKYVFFGDPSLQPSKCFYDIALNVFDKAGNPLDTLKALQDILIRGSIRTKGKSEIATDYGSAYKSAFVNIHIFNPPYVTTRKDKGLNDAIRYSMPGSLLFGNQTDVYNGTFEQPLHLPRKVTFKKPGAKITAFAWQGFENGVGSKDFVFKGSFSETSSDTSGPTIAIRPLYDQTGSVGPNKTALNAFTNDRIRAVVPFSCEIFVFDSSGVDVSGTGPDEGLTIEIPGVFSKQNINQKFRFGEGDYKKGSAAMEFTEGMVHPGMYTMSISAQDLAGNVTRREFFIDISKGRDLAISQVFNFPNPMKMGTSTTFYFNLSKTLGVTSMIKVFTLSGKLIRVFYGTNSGVAFDGRDQVGNLLGPNVYLYQVIAEDHSQAQKRTVKSGIQKLAVHPPR